MQKYKAGDLVEILSMDEVLSYNPDYKIGDICEILSVWKSSTDVRYTLKVYTTDKENNWWFREDQVRTTN